MNIKVTAFTESKKLYYMFCIISILCCFFFSGKCPVNCVSPGQILYGFKKYEEVVYPVCCYRVNLVIFRQTAKFGQQPCLFHISNIRIKNKLTKQTVKVSSVFTLFADVCPNLPDVRIYPTLP